MKGIKSLGIDRAVQIAIEAGNSIKEISEGWSDVQQVVCMENGLTAAVRNDIQRHVPATPAAVARATRRRREGGGRGPETA